MPTISATNLVLTTVDTNTTINVTYNATFSPFERFLAANGMVFREQITVIGVDPPGGTTGTILATFGYVILPVTAGAVPQTIARNRSMTVSRSSLQEDPAPGDNDEIRCRVEIVPVGFPATVSALSPQRVLLG